MITSFYNEEEIVKLGLKKYGKNVLISRKASFYSPELIQLGSNVRIDDFCRSQSEYIYLTSMSVPT